MFRTVRLPENVLGRLSLHSMPGRYEGWDEFVAEFRRCKIDSIVCLTSEDEIERKSPAYAEAIKNRVLPCWRESFPISDYDVPLDREQYAAFVGRIAELLRSGHSILVHCGAGIGRTGMFAICLLIAVGLNRTEAVKAILAARSRPETDEQRELVDWCEREFQNGQH